MWRGEMLMGLYMIDEAAISIASAELFAVFYWAVRRRLHLGCIGTLAFC